MQLVIKYISIVTLLDTIYILTHNNKISEYPYRNIFFLMGLTAVIYSSLIKMLHVTQISCIFSTGIKDAGPHGLNKPLHQISTGLKILCLVACSWNHLIYAILTTV